ncbi:Alpha-L-fucosidase 2 [Heracleum sosnowskyi]|uniref:Alpha-L-fucosidase 2 n=1 Tax=Heracleum sosnowskyi TaxID=360622 RepID=A0AAD8IGZ9_9APIA|nr:Alpha-L-fucosidase 2 [Heracleum sosnowskyi]
MEDRDVWSPSKMVNVQMEKTSKPLKIRSFEPAKHWTDALPSGNGRLGGMIWVGVVSDTINLNDDTIWTGDPGNYTNPDAPKVLSEVRKLVNDGKYAEATKAAVNFSGTPSQAYQLLGDIKLDFDESHAAYDKETYERELDLNTAMVTVKYTAGGITYTREHFSSSPDQVIVTNISSSKTGSLSFTVYLDSKLHYESRLSGQNQIIMEGGNPMAIKFSAVLDLKISDGTGKMHVVDDKKIKVEGADWSVIRLTASSSFDGPFTKSSKSKKNPTSESLQDLDLIKNFSYAELSARHLNDYQKLFHRVSLQLSKSSKSVAEDLSFATGKHLKATEDDKVSTAQRVKSFKTDEDPSYVELLFQYGRYLLISCSRPGTQASNLQGIWNKDVMPPWEYAISSFAIYLPFSVQ